jgi:glycosyltransferase involved in cell wall biosynthesis
VTAPRVVHVVRSDAFAGVERYVADTATELSARGWPVTVVGGEPAAMRRRLPDAVEYRPAGSVAAVFGALRAVRQCAIVHAHMTAAELPAALLKNTLGARLVVTRHFAAPRGRTWLGRVAGAVITRRVDLQVAISDFVAGAAGGRCVVLPNGVRDGTDAPSPRERIVAVLQRLEPEKDTATALRAWAASGLGDEGWRLLIHGAGSERDRLRSLAGTLSITDTVTFAGFTDDARGVLRTAALLLAPAPAEPFGLAVVEAMAEATPVVAADGGAHRETLGADGRFFPPGDAQACAAQLGRLARASSAERGALGERLRARQRATFSLAAHVTSLERLYREQLAHRTEDVRGR